MGKAINLLLKIQEDIQAYQDLKNLYTKTKDKAVGIRLKYAHNRVQCDINRLKDIVCSQVVHITYKLNGIYHEALLTNMSKNDAVHILDMVLAKPSNSVIEYLEIKEIPTYLIDSKL